MKRNHFSTIETAIEATANGKVLIIVDSEEREDEGDFFIAAEAITPNAVHFMISEGRGQLCMPLLPELATQLALEPMISSNRDKDQPRFAIPVDHRSCRSGISPHERSLTIRAMIDTKSRPEDFTRPGHVFPLLAEAGGVLSRTGHTEAAVDLCRLAGLSGAGVICEVCSRDGIGMARRPELTKIANQFDLHMITIDDLVQFRERKSSCQCNWKTSQSLQECT
ncbi:Riboflavin biosynthesis protein RibBA [Symmachiella macrocystis]|uniref:3,4-dihydroxy-2-butanone 4-phosphate synthase n=1 Tax=Symmachiella macrocystis TaxID=2527985 RepID=A0A5C6B1U3_9PLAN|nr:3,4-dihydroxy-2-butanone-4-phosphate synthase [Symmachiella macrocystis]TWU05206.1 Riboflavin biosynthesis protein RibBA [Symmachiella macrocystis]